MDIKGMAILAEHVPELNSLSGKIRAILYAAFLIALVTIYFVVTDNIPTWSIDSQIIIVALGFLVLSLFFSRKQAYKERYGKLAYRNAFTHFVMPGLALIFGSVAHAGYMNGPEIPQGWWSIMFSTLGWVSLLIGLALCARSIFTFGADNLALLYVYHPEKGQIVNSSIYSVLRHPIYAGVLRLFIGLALINGNANSIAFAVLIPLGFVGWTRLVEEKELIERFGETYIEYRKQTPAFFPKPRDVAAFFNFLLTGK